MAQHKAVYNSTTIPLAAGAVFLGQSTTSEQWTNIRFSLASDTKCQIEIEQSQNEQNWELTTTFDFNPAEYPHGRIYQQTISYRLFRVRVTNVSAVNQTYLRCLCYLLTEPNIRSNSVQDNVEIHARNPENKAAPLQVTSLGDLLVNGTAGSATRPVYLMDVGTWYRVASVGNTPGHVWTSIGAIVGSETEPTIGRLFKCLYAPANIQGQGEVYDVEYSDTITAIPVGTQDVSVVQRSGTGYLSYLTDNVAVATMPAITGSVSVTSQPHLSYLTDNIAVATMPAITGSVALLPAVDPTLTLGTIRMTDVYGSPIVSSSGNLLIGISNIYTTNPLHTILDSGSVGITGSVAVTNADITSIKTNTARFGLAIGSNYEESVINTFTNLSISGGYLYNLNVYSDGSSGTNFLKVYGVAGATIADTPLLIVPVPHATSVNLSLSGLKALTGISVRATANYGVTDNNAPTNSISCNLIFSPLV